MIKVLKFLILLICLPSVANTYIPISLDKLISSSQWILKATVVSRTPIYKCIGKNCEEGYLYELSVTTEFKGKIREELFCSTYSFEPEVEYLFFLQKFYGYLTFHDEQLHQDCGLVSTYNERDIFRFSKVNDKTVVDIANPPSVVFPEEIAYYDPVEENAKDGGWYFSADWEDLKEYIELKLK